MAVLLRVVCRVPILPATVLPGHTEPPVLAKVLTRTPFSGRSWQSVACMAFLPIKCSRQLVLAITILGLASSHVLAFIAFPGGGGVLGRRALRNGNAHGLSTLQRSPHAGLDEKGLLVERLLEAKVS